MPVLDNSKDEHFALAVAKGESATKSYVSAGYSPKGPSGPPPGCCEMLWFARGSASCQCRARRRATAVGWRDLRESDPSGAVLFPSTDNSPGEDIGKRCATRQEV
jgi:hypothetical protein